METRSGRNSEAARLLAPGDIMDPCAITDAQLIAASIGGERRAFGALIERYQNLVCAVAYSATGDIALSEDVGQETFVEAWKRLADIQEPDKFRGWLCGTARNLARMALRRRKRVVTDGGNSAHGLESPDASALEKVISEEQKALVWHALEAIPQSYREPLVLFYREEQSVKQVAQGLDLSEEATKQRLTRGRQALRDELAKVAEVTLSRTRPSHAFSATILERIGSEAGVAAASTVTAGSASGTTAAARPMGLLLGGKMLVVAATLALVAASAPLWPSNAETTAPAEQAHAEPAPTATAAIPAGAASSPGPTSHQANSSGADRPGLPPRAHALSDADRQALHDAIARQRRARLAHPAHPAAATAAVDAHPAEPLSLANKIGESTDWDNRQLAILNELLADCYRLAKQEQPDLWGKLGIRYTITGEPGVGGLVHDVRFMDDYSTIDQPTMRECTSQSLHALELDPPPEGVSLDRQITLRFDP